MEIRQPVVVAEVGCNHMGDMEIAKRMIVTAKQFCQVDHVKFQKRNPAECLTPQQYAAPHPEPHHSYGATYGEHRERLEFTLEQHRELKRVCEDNGVVYFASVWDVTSAREIVSLQPKIIKVPSACNTNRELLEYLFKSFTGNIHVSLGMTTRQEEDQLIYWAKASGRLQDLVVYCCTSGYPVPAKDVCLLEIVRLKRDYGTQVKAVGFSGHHQGIAIDIASVTLGSDWVERHFTLDRTWKGSDHAASLEPDGLRRLRRDCQVVCRAMTYKPQEILDIEKPQRNKLKRLP